MTTIDLKAREIQPLRHTFAHVAKYIGADKYPNRYEEATLGAQPAVNFHYRPTWDPEHELFDAARSAVKLADWYVLRDPRQFYYASWTITRAQQQTSMEANHQFVESRGLATKMSEAARAKACEVLMPLRHVVDTQVQGRYRFVDWPPEKKVIDIGSFYADSTLFKARTGWAPQVPLADGLRRTFDYYRPRMAHYV